MRAWAGAYEHVGPPATPLAATIPERTPCSFAHPITQCSQYTASCSLYRTPHLPWDTSTATQAFPHYIPSLHYHTTFSHYILTPTSAAAPAAAASSCSDTLPLDEPPAAPAAVAALAVEEEEKARHASCPGSTSSKSTGAHAERTSCGAQQGHIAVLVKVCREGAALPSLGVQPAGRVKWCRTPGLQLP